MKSVLYSCLFAALLCLNIHAQNGRQQIAVLNLEAVGVSESESITLSDRLRSELVNSGAFTVIERNEMETILEKQGFQQTGCTSEGCRFCQILLFIL